MTELISIKGLGKTYRIGFWMKSVRALDKVDLSVCEGDLFGFIGPNGAGKSTAIKTLLGLLRFNEGEVRLMGLPPSSPNSREQVGYLPEHPYFYDYLTGFELLKFYGSLAGLKGRELSSRIDESIARVKAKPQWMERKLRTYSKGMLQRVGLAQSILTKPKLLILDEPMSGLDPMGRKDVRELLQSLHQEGTTIFYSSHVLSDVEAICNKVAMIVGGTMRRQGSVKDILASEGGHSLEDILAEEVARDG